MYTPAISLFLAKLSASARGIAPTSVAVYAGFVDAFAHAGTVGSVSV